MTNSFEFGFDHNPKGVRLYVEGPREQLSEMLEATQGNSRHGVSGRRLFTELKTDSTDRAAWSLNAIAVSRMAPKAKLAALSRANNLFGAVAKQSHNRVPGESLFVLQTYELDPYEGVFDFTAEVMTPASSREAVASVAAEYMLRMASDLRSSNPTWRRPERRSELVRPSVFYGRSGIDVQLTRESNMHTPGRTWDESSPYLTLVGDNIRGAEQPLIYLAGAVAIAHADELVRTVAA